MYTAIIDAGPYSVANSIASKPVNMKMLHRKLLGRTVQMSLFLLRALCVAKVVSTDVKFLCSLSGKPENKGKIDGQYTYKRKTEAPSSPHCCRGKAIRIKFT